MEAKVRALGPAASWLSYAELGNRYPPPVPPQRSSDGDGCALRPLLVPGGLEFQLNSSALQTGTWRDAVIPMEEKPPSHTPGFALSQIEVGIICGHVEN